MTVQKSKRGKVIWLTSQQVQIYAERLMVHTVKKCLWNRIKTEGPKDWEKKNGSLWAVHSKRDIISD